MVFGCGGYLRVISLVCLACGGMGLGSRVSYGCGDDQTAPSQVQIHWEHRFGGMDVAEAQIFDMPIDLAVGPKNRVYVLDSRDNNIKVFSGDGEYIKTFGREGAGPGELNRPWIGDVIGDELHVVDANNGRVQVYSVEGDYLRCYQVAAEFGVGMAFGPDGCLYLNTRGFRAPKLMRAYKIDGSKRLEFGDLDGESFEYFDFTAIKRDIKGGKIPAAFKNDVIPAVGTDGTIWVVYRSLPRLMRFTAEGELIRAHEIDHEEYEDIFRTFLEENRKIDNQPSRFYPLIYVNDLDFDDRGHLYALLNSPTRMTMLEFSPEGRLMRTLEGPQERISRIAFDGLGRLYALGVDSHFIYRFDHI